MPLTNPPVAISAGTQLGSTGTVVFSNSNGVTFGLNANTLTASVNAGGGGSVNFSAGTTSNNLNSVVFSNSNNVTFGLNGSTVTASASSPAETPFGVSAGTQSVSTGTLVFSNSNNITFGMSGSSRVTGSYNFNLSAGTTSNNLNAATFSNSNNVSFGLNGSVVTASATVASTQGSINLSAGTTSNLASAFTFSNSNGVSFGLNGSVITGSVATSLTNINVSAGTTSNNLSALVFSNSNGVSFGLNGSTVTATVTPGAAAGIGAINAGTQTATSGTVVFANSNGVTFGMSGSSQITASYAFNLSAGTTSNALSAVTFSNSNNVSFGLNASTMTATAALTMDYFDNIGDMPGAATGTGAAGSWTAFTGSHRSLFVFPLQGQAQLWPGDITANTMFFPDVSLSGSTATMSLAFTSQWFWGIYTANSNTLSLLNSGSVSFGFGAANVNNSTAFAGGLRFATVHSSLWSSSPVFKNGSHYYMAWFWSSAGAVNQTGAMAGMFNYSSAQRSGLLGASNLTATSNGWGMWNGIYTATTNALPATIGSAELNKVNSLAYFRPHVILAQAAASTVF